MIPPPDESSGWKQLTSKHSEGLNYGLTEGSDHPQMGKEPILVKIQYKTKSQRSMVKSTTTSGILLFHRIGRIEWIWRQSEGGDETNKISKS